MCTSLISSLAPTETFKHEDNYSWDGAALGAPLGPWAQLLGHWVQGLTPYPTHPRPGICWQHNLKSLWYSIKTHFLLSFYPTRCQLRLLSFCVWCNVMEHYTTGRPVGCLEVRWREDVLRWGEVYLVPVLRWASLRQHTVTTGHQA